MKQDGNIVMAIAVITLLVASFALITWLAWSIKTGDKRTETKPVSYSYFDSSYVVNDV